MAAPHRLLERFGTGDEVDEDIKILLMLSDHIKFNFALSFFLLDFEVSPDFSRILKCEINFARYQQFHNFLNHLGKCLSPSDLVWTNLILFFDRFRQNIAVKTQK